MVRAQVVLVVLKLAHVLNTSWWVIWLPTLIPVGVVVAIFLIMFICALVSPRFRAFIHEAADEAEEERVKIEINGGEDGKSDTSR